MSEEEQKHLMQSYYDLHEQYDKQKQEIERLNERYNNLVEEHIDTITRNEDYRARIDKAIEYIENQKLHKFQDTTGGLTYNERKLLEILKGD